MNRYISMVFTGVLILSQGCAVSVYKTQARPTGRESRELLPGSTSGTEVNKHEPGAHETQRASAESETQIFSVVTDPENAFRIVAQNVEITNSTKVPLGSSQALLDTNQRLAFTTLRLAEPLDNVTTQAMAGYKAALFGLNSNPTGCDNQDNFWKALKDINSTARMMRLNKQNQDARIALARRGVSVNDPRGGNTVVFAFTPVGQVISSKPYRSPWFDTKIDVELGDMVCLRVSGEVCSAVHHLVDDAKVHRLGQFRWDGPEGWTPRDSGRMIRAMDGIRLAHALLPESPYGALIARICPESERDSLDDAGRAEGAFLVGDANYEDGELPGEVRPHEGRKFLAGRKGRLYLSINEPMLGRPGERAAFAHAKEVYAPHFDVAQEFVEDGKKRQKWAGLQYYLQKLSEWVAFSEKNEEADKLALEQGLGKFEELNGIPGSTIYVNYQKLKDDLSAKYSEQLAQWNSIDKTDYWTAWFDDNIGAFYVQVWLPSGAAFSSDP